MAPENKNFEQIKNLNIIKKSEFSYHWESSYLPS